MMCSLISPTLVQGADIASIDTPCLIFDQPLPGAAAVDGFFL